MIDYRTYCKIRHLWLRRHIPLRQIARMLSLSRQTVRKWAKKDKFEAGKRADQTINLKAIRQGASFLDNRTAFPLGNQHQDFKDTDTATEKPSLAAQRTASKNHFDSPHDSWMLMLLLGSVKPSRPVAQSNL